MCLTVNYCNLCSRGRHLSSETTTSVFYQADVHRAVTTSLSGCLKQPLVQFAVRPYRWPPCHSSPHRTTTADTAVWSTNGARFWKPDSSARCREPTASRRTLMSWVSAQFIISLFEILPSCLNPLGASTPLPFFHLWTLWSGSPSPGGCMVWDWSVKRLSKIFQIINVAFFWGHVIETSATWWEKGGKNGKWTVGNSYMNALSPFSNRGLQMDLLLTDSVSTTFPIFKVLTIWPPFALHAFAVMLRR